jgi:hypothetical protein
MKKICTDRRKSDGASYREWVEAVSRCHPIFDVIPDWIWRKCYDDDMTPWEAAADNT